MLNQVLVSIIIPIRNEEKFIGKCLDSILANNYPKNRLEVLMVDGRSEDKSREIVERYARQFPFLKVLENPKRITPCALNIGVKNARGEIIIRMDAHTVYEKDYIMKCVKYLEEFNADDIGGVWKILPTNNTAIGKGIANVLSHPFGIGNAYYRFVNSKEPRWVDTFPFFCCKREVFERIGLFNENLVRGQDMEFNLRLKKAGGRALLVPDIVSYYYARSDIKSFWKLNWANGIWAILPFLYSDIMPVCWRHLVPLVFITGLLVSGVLGFLAEPFLWLFFTIISCYGLANLAASLHIAWQEKAIGYIIAMPFIFSMLHIGYGLGSLWGVLKLIGTPNFWSKLLRLVW